MTNEHREQAREIVDEASDHFWRDGTDVLRVTSDFDKLTERIAAALSARDQEIKEVLEGLSVELPRCGRCWCPYMHNQHGEDCLAAREVWEKVNHVD